MVAVKSNSKLKLKFRRQRFTELTDSQWQYIKDFFDSGRKRKYCLRIILNAIFKITRTGCQWRNLESRYASYPTRLWGLPIAIHVSSANISDAVGGFDLLAQTDHVEDNLELIRGDKTYGKIFKEAAPWYNFEVDTSQ